MPSNVRTGHGRRRTRTWAVPDQKQKPQQKGGNVVASNNQFL